MRIALLNDSHFGIKNSSDVHLDYVEKFFKEIFFPYCVKNQIKTVIHAGDYLDNRKYVSFKALKRARKAFLEPLVENGMEMIIIPGNHDVAYKNTNELCGLREVLGYFKKSIKIITSPTTGEFDGCQIGFLPWIAPDNYAESMKFVTTTTAPVLVSHLELSGFMMMKGQTAMEHGMDASLFSRFEMVLSGHYHTKQTLDNIYYLGTQYEQTWTDCDDPKYFHTFDTQTRELLEVKNPFTLYERVVYDDRDDSPENYDTTKVSGKYVKVIVIKKTNPIRFDKFMDNLSIASPLEPPRIIESFDEYASDLVEDDQVSLEDTSKLLHSYIDGVETSLDKERLKRMMGDLYTEAQAVDTI